MRHFSFAIGRPKGPTPKKRCQTPYKRRSRIYKQCYQVRECQVCRFLKSLPLNQGTFTPRRIPVNVLLPSGNQTDDLFGPTELNFLHGTRPKIVMTCPERAPISGLIEITVEYDEKKPRGISVNIQGTVGLDINASNLEEVCRRGGTWGLPGRIWASGHGFS